MDNDQKQPDVPGIGNQQFQIQLDPDQMKVCPHQLYCGLVQSMYGTEWIVNRMVARYESQSTE